MNCRRVEKLIPLYVEGDLASGAAGRLALHLEWCGRCNWLADEYKESQSWLRAFEPPEFDEASLNGFKAGVLRRIEETSARPSLLASLIQQWSRRQVFALSVAMLIIFGVVVFYIYQARMSARPGVVEAVKAREGENPPSNEQRQTPGTEEATGASLSKPHHTNDRASIKSRAVTQVVPVQNVEPPFVSQMKRPEESGTAPTEPPDAFPDELPAMLRIEIQTSDPNIRIIWFAPKEVESPKTNQ